MDELEKVTSTAQYNTHITLGTTDSGLKPLGLCYEHVMMNKLSDWDSWSGSGEQALSNGGALEHDQDALQEVIQEGDL